jgi:hypothetical protein
VRFGWVKALNTGSIAALFIGIFSLITFTIKNLSMKDETMQQRSITERAKKVRDISLHIFQVMQKVEKETIAMAIPSTIPSDPQTYPGTTA